MQASARSVHDAPEPSSPQQQGLPTGPTHVVARATRTPAEVESNRAFLAAAGRVEFGRYEATLRDVWMAFAYFASLGPERTCYGSVEHVAEKARRSASTLRRKALTLIDRGLLKPDQRKGGRVPSTWKVVLPDAVLEIAGPSPDVRGSQNDWAGQSKRLGRAVTVTDDIRDREKRENSTSSSARVVCPDCGNNWPAEYGKVCHKCRDKPSPRAPADKPKADAPACSCGDAYRNRHGRLCVDCDGEPSSAQVVALREKHGGGGAHEGVGVDGGGAAGNPAVQETATRQPPETRGQRPDSSVSPEHGSPPNGGEPGPNARRFFADFAQWTVGKRTRLQHGSDRRRLARTARHDLADLAKGEQAND